MISEGYRKLNTELHRNDKSYGTSGYKFKKFAENMVKVYESTDVLDYGCGKATLSTSITDVVSSITNYDPAIPAFSEVPRPHDIVFCTDVMEHIEPEHIDAVLDDLKRVTKKALFMTIANRPAQKVLADGRNAHIIQEDYRWWLPKLWKRFRLVQFVGSRRDCEYLIVLEANDYR